MQPTLPCPARREAKERKASRFKAVYLLACATPML
jgi:hypothetical protein